MLGVNRFFLSSLSAALPHVVAGDELVMANSVSPTAGGVMATIGGLVALGLNVGTGNTERGAALTLLAGGACYVAASLVAATMRRDLLGPVRAPGQPPPGRLAGELASAAAGLAAGARYVIRRRGPTAALAVTGGYSFLFGPLFLMVILLYRNYFYTSSAGTAEGHLGSMVVASGIGYFCAALVTPQATRRLSKPTWITLLVAASAVLTAALGETFIEIAYLALGFGLYLARQGVAICATTILQEEADDAYRGRIFAFYDMMFNVTYAAGAGLSAAFMPDNGHAPAIVALVAAGFAILAAAYWLFQRTGQAPSSGSGSRRRRGYALGRRPAQQLLSGLLPADRATRHPQFQQEVIRPPHQRAGGQAEDRHDVVAVQLRPDASQFLLRAELGNALLEAVVRAGQPQGPGPVPGRAVGPGQHVQPGEQRPGVPDVTAHGRIRPLALTVTVEPQVQFDQLGNVADHVVRETQRSQPAAGQLRADHLVQVELHPPVGQQRPGLRLADVVQQRGQPHGQVAVQRVARLQLDGLGQHGEAVLVDVLVAVMLVRLHPQPGHLRQHLVGGAGLNQEVDAPRGVRGEHELGQLAGHAFGGDDPQPRRLLGHGRTHLGRDGEAQLGREPGRAHDPQRVVAEGVLGPSGGAQHPLSQGVEAAERVDQLVAGQPGRHRVDGEVPAAQVLLERPAVPHLGLAGGGLVLLAAVGGDLEHPAALAQAHGAERDPDGPDGVGPALDHGQDLLRGGVRGQVEIGGLLASEHVPDRAADQGQLVAVPREQAADAGDLGDALFQQRGGRLPLFVGHGHGH